MNKNLVSIIIPAYNLEKHLFKCLNSVISQTYKNLEIIIVNDGSTDKTKDVIDDFLKKDSRILAVHQKNQGLSASRNNGIKISTGDFISLIDGDDAIAPNFIEDLLKHITASNDIDIAVCGYQTVYPGKTTKHNIPNEILTGPAATIKCLTKQEDYNIIACNKLYRHQLFDNIKYPPEQIHEDNLTTYKLLAAAKKVIYFSAPLYQYYKRKGSITDRSKLLDQLKIKEQAANEAKVYFQNQTKLSQAADIALLLSKFAYLDNIIKENLPKNELYDENLKFIQANATHYHKNPLISKKLKFYLRLINTKNAFAYRLFRKIV